MPITFFGVGQPSPLGTSPKTSKQKGVLPFALMFLGWFQEVKGWPTSKTKSTILPRGGGLGVLEIFCGAGAGLGLGYGRAGLVG